MYKFHYNPNLTKESITQADRHRLGLSVVGQRSLAKFSSNTRLLVSSEWNLVVQHIVGVNPDGTGTELVGDTDGSVEVLGVDSSGETVAGVVSGLDNLLLSLELGDRADGAEDLLLHDLHVLSDIGENGRLDEVSLVTVTLTSSDDGGTRLLTLGDVTHNTVVLELGDLWSLEGVGVEWIADLVLGGTLLESLNKLVVDTGLNVDTGTSTAALAVVEENTKVDPRDGIINIGIVEDNVW